jgi:hypothetical protein
MIANGEIERNIDPKLGLRMRLYKSPREQNAQHRKLAQLHLKSSPYLLPRFSRGN